MSRFITCWLVFFFSIVLPGCSPVKVSYDFDQEADFSTIHTFDWKDVAVKNDALAKNPLLKKRILRSIEIYLTNRGYVRAKSMAPDMYIAVHAGMQEKMQVTNWGGRMGYYSDPWYDPWWGYGPYGGRVDVNYYTEGTLIIDMVAAKKKELIWRGVGTKIVHSYSDQEKMQKAIDEYIAKILEQFPPGYESHDK